MQTIQQVIPNWGSSPSEVFPFNFGLNFYARSLVVDNTSGRWLRFNGGPFVAPYTMQAIVSFDAGVRAVNVALEAPQNVASNTGLAGEIVITAFEGYLGSSPGVSSPGRPLSLLGFTFTEYTVQVVATDILSTPIAAIPQLSLKAPRANPDTVYIADIGPSATAQYGLDPGQGIDLFNVNVGAGQLQAIAPVAGCLLWVILVLPNQL